MSKEKHIDIGLNSYELEEEAGILYMEPEELGQKYTFLQEFPSMDTAALQYEQQKEIAEGEKAGPEAAGPQQQQLADPQADAAPEATPAEQGQESPERTRMVEQLSKFGEELEMIVADNMYNLTFDYVYKLLQFRSEVENSDHKDIYQSVINLLHKTARVIYMAPNGVDLDLALKINLIQDYMIPTFPVLTLEMERIWQFLLKARDDARAKG